MDVGQGDSAWLHAADSTDILIDSGPVSAGPTVLAYLQEESIDNVDVMVLTHAHADHVGGLIDVLQSTIPVEAVITNGQPHTSQLYQELITALQARALTPTPAVVGQEHTWGPLSATVPGIEGIPTGDQNDDSVVLRVSDSQVQSLFTGDISTSAEETILDSGLDVTAEISKDAHHGSRYGSSTTFPNAVGPEVAVISVGDNSYGHPAEQTLTRLRESGARVLRTDLRGTVVVVSDGMTCRVLGDFHMFLPIVVRQ